MKRELSFTLPPEIDSDVLGRAPIVVMNHDLAVVEKTSLNQTVALEPGVYLARTVLPDGRAFETVFTVPDEGALEPIVLVDQSRLKQELDDMVAAGMAASEAVVTRALKVVPHALQRVAVFGSSLIQDLGVAWEGRRSRLLLVTLDPATGVASEHLELQVNEQGKVDVDPSEERRIARVERYGKPDINMAVPTSLQEGARICFAPGTDAVLDVRLQDEDAELLRRYLVSASVPQLSQTLESQWDRARDMLHGKFERPIAATVGAYALISVGAPAGWKADAQHRPDWLERWIGTLFADFPWLPDGVYLHAEMLARKGWHEHAAAVLLDNGPARGLPMFSIGLRFALDRLQAYRSAAETVDWAAARRTEIEALLESLSAIACYTDFAQPLLAFTTNVEGKPGEEARASGDPVHAPAPAVLAQV